MTQDWIQQTDEESQKASGGGGVIAQCEIRKGYKIFVGGMDNRQSFFPYDASSEASKATAKKKAEDTGNKAQDSVELVVFKATVKGKEATWKDDRFFTYPIWTVEFKQVFWPSVKEQKPPLAQKFWAKIGFAPNPNPQAKKREYQGEMRAEPIAVISKMYKDEAEATADAGQGSNGSEPHDPMIPEGYSKELWLGSKAEIVKELDAVAQGIANEMKGKPGPLIKKALMDAKNAKVAQLAEQYVATVDQINHLIDS